MPRASAATPDAAPLQVDAMRRARAPQREHVAGALRAIRVDDAARCRRVARRV